MKILVGKTFGIGNCLLSIPLIRSLRQRYPLAIIDVLVGSLPDDTGSQDVFWYLKENAVIDQIYVNQARQGGEYDVAIIAIPFDGRWQNGREFTAKITLDQRPRPDSSTFGFSSWKKHEVEYQMENAYVLGYQGEIPMGSYLKENEPLLWNTEKVKNTIYLGLGYKRDAVGFWKAKHWGNDNYAQMMRKLFLKNKEIEVITTGNQADYELSFLPISLRLKEWDLAERFNFIKTTNIKMALSVINSCYLYIGNDTGMMHAAAACGKKVIGIYNLAGTITKNHAWTPNRVDLDGSETPVSIDQVLEAI